MRALDCMTSVLTPGGRDRDLHHRARALGAAAHLRVDRRAPAAACGCSSATEIVEALEQRGFADVRQRITGVTQFVGGRLAGANRASGW